MESLISDENKMKQLLKEALLEALIEQKDVFHDLIAEAIEDIALANAIHQGADQDSVARAEISDILKSD